MATKPSKPSVTAPFVRIALAGALFSTGATAITLWATVVGHWPAVAFDVAWGITLLTWIGTFALAHARHVTLYIYGCTKTEIKRIERVDIQTRRSVINEAERYLTEGGM